MRNSKGMTLVEVLVALVIFLFVSLAMMQTALVSIHSNMLNVLRDEAVGIADMRMGEARNLPFTQTVDNLVSDGGSLSGANCPTGFSPTGTGMLVERNVRSVTGFDFCTNRKVDLIGTDFKQVTIKVGWIWKGQDYTHTISTLVKKR